MYQCIAYTKKSGYRKRCTCPIKSHHVCEYHLGLTTEDRYITEFLSMNGLKGAKMFPKEYAAQRVSHNIYGKTFTYKRSEWKMLELIRLRLKLPRPIFYNKIMGYIEVLHQEERLRELARRRAEELKALQKPKDCEERSPNGNGCGVPVKKRYCLHRADYYPDVDQYLCVRHYSRLMGHDMWKMWQRNENDSS